MIKNILFLILSIVVFNSCKKQPVIDDTMLDGDKISDPSIANPEKYLVSYALPNPSPEQKQTPVLIAVHGYSATTFEWDEFRHWADSAGGIFVSQVLLGGHGRNYEAFRKSSWIDWQKPIIEEYARLSLLGYTNISLVGSSTGAPLIVEMIYSRKIANYTQPKHVLLIDPIIVSSSKMLALADYVWPALPYIKSQLDEGEVGHWYQYRPQETLNQLLNLIDKVRKKLESGIILPPSTTMKVYKATKDNAADPVSAVVLYNGTKQSDGSKIEIEMENSDIHVFTRLHGRKTYTETDKELQLKTFKDFQRILSR